MNLQHRLISFREYKKLQQEYVAKQLGLSLELYKDVEESKLNISNILAQKLSDLYQAPIELFLTDEILQHRHTEVLYNNCTFISTQGNCSGYVNHQYNDRGIDEIVFAKNEEIKFLKHQVQLLQQQIAEIQKKEFKVSVRKNVGESVGENVGEN